MFKNLSYNKSVTNPTLKHKKNMLLLPDKVE
jgi:hypothetical protein